MEQDARNCAGIKISNRNNENMIKTKVKADTQEVVFALHCT